MINIHLIAVGKLKERYWKEAEAEYLKRLQPSATIIFHELKEESFTEKDPVDFIKEKEAKKILEVLEKIKDSYIFILEEHGKQFSSVALAKQFSHLAMEQFNNFTFIIGGPLGISESVRKRANTTLSLSPLTFTHQMTRVILLEQIYRAMMINTGRRYHY